MRPKNVVAVSLPEHIISSYKTVWVLEIVRLISDYFENIYPSKSAAIKYQTNKQIKFPLLDQISYSNDQIFAKLILNEKMLHTITVKTFYSLLWMFYYFLNIVK